MSTNITIDSKNNRLAKVNNLGFTSYTARKYEPQTQNTFAFEFLFSHPQVAYIATFANNQISPITGAEEIDAVNYSRGLSQINEILNSSMQSINSPTKTISQIVIDFFNSQIKFAGKPTYNNASITFNTLIGLGTKNVLAGWNDICQSERTLEGGWGRDEPGYTVPARGSQSASAYLDTLFSHVGYKVDGLLLECARDGSIVNSWKYIGMWLQTFTPGNYNMSGSSTPSQVSATLCVDKIVQSDIAYIKQELGLNNNSNKN